MDHTKATQFVTAGLLLTHGLMRHCEEPDYDRIIDLDGHDLPRIQAGIFEHWFGD